MIVTTVHIPYKYGDTIRIKPLFDLHRGNKHSDTAALKRYLSDSDDKTYFIGGGDMFDSIVTKDPRFRKATDATETDSITDEQIDDLEKILIPYRERIIGLGDGNHEKQVELRCGTNMIGRLCKRLSTDDHKIVHLGFSWLIRLKLSEGGNRGRIVIIRGHHGWGGGSRTQGADLTKYSKDMQYWDADIFLYGHVHRKQSDKVPRLGLVGDKLVSKPKLLGICGTFLKTYSGNIHSTYSEEKGYPPVEVGGIEILLRPTQNWIDMSIRD